MMRPDDPPETDLAPEPNPVEPDQVAEPAPALPDPEAQPEPTVEVQGSPAGTEDPDRPTHAADPVRRRALLPWVIAASALIVLGSIAFALTFTPLFRADEIRISGEDHLSEARILKITGLSGDTNLLHADLEGARGRLERQPWIERATITRSLPHGLEIQVVERVPVAITEVDGGRVLVSTEGVNLGGAAGERGLPAVVAVEGAGDLDPSALRSGAAAAAAMPPALRAQVASISVDVDGSIAVRTRGGILVTYGEPTQLEAKAQSLKAVLAWASREARALAAVDVTVPGAPTARLSGGVVVAP